MPHVAARMATRDEDAAVVRVARPLAVGVGHAHAQDLTVAVDVLRAVLAEPSVFIGVGLPGRLGRIPVLPGFARRRPARRSRRPTRRRLRIPDDLVDLERLHPIQPDRLLVEWYDGNGIAIGVQVDVEAAGLVDLA